IPFTTSLKAVKIPSLISTKISPATEKTPTTFSQASEKISPKKEATLLNTVLIPSHASEAALLTSSHIPEKKSEIGWITFSSNQLEAIRHASSIISQQPSAITPIL